MKKSEFFIKAAQAGNLAFKSFIFRAFSITSISAVDTMIPWGIMWMGSEQTASTLNQQPDNVVFLNERSETITLSDYNYDPGNPQPPFSFKDVITLKKGDLPNVDKDLNTTYGNVVLNWLLGVYPFNDKIPFFTGKLKISQFEKIIEKRLVDGLSTDSDASSQHIYTDEYIRFKEAASLLDGYSQLCVPSASAKTLTHHPDRDKLRDELLEKYSDRLHDPATAAIINAALEKLDREWMSGDEAEGFFIKDKSFNTVRMKTHGIMGLHDSFSDTGETPKYITTSLSDGMKAEDLPAIANNSREGSFDRGAETQLGGEAVKFILRVMQNVTLEIDDCGSDVGIMMPVNDANKETMIGNTIIANKKLVKLTDDNIKSYFNTLVELRTPAYCRAERDGFCKTCIGDRYAENPTALATAASGIGSTFMGLFMASMHGKALKTNTYKFEDYLT